MSLEQLHAPIAAEETAAAPPVSIAGEIAVTDVHKTFGVTRALDGCNFIAALGEIHAIVGGNGSGKSTLAKVISGVLPIDSGQVSVLGHAPATPHEARALGIATVFQEVLVADECSIVDNLFLGADHLWSRSLSNAAKVRAARNLMAELTGSELEVEMLVGGLPLSIKQWIVIGRALLCRPKILILDESSAALDLDSTERLFAKMRELRDAGSAVILVTHRIAELIRISDRATVLRDGRDVGVLEKRDITEKNLLGLMTGKPPSAPVSASAARDVLKHDVVMRTRRLKIWPNGSAIDFSLHKGEVLGIAGLDGQGQNDFVRVLAGVQRAAEGTPLVRDPAGGFAEIRGLSDAARYAVSYVSGDRKREGIFANLSIFENLLMPLYSRTARGGKLAIIAWNLLSGVFDWEVARLSIKMGDRTNPIVSLSGGNQQKVLIGRAFALNPEILVLNDPARGVDVGAKSELYKYLAAFAARGKSVIYLSSEIEEFIGFCTRVIVFRHGAIFDELTESAIEPARILEAMFGQTQGIHGHLEAEEPDSVAAAGRQPVLDWRTRSPSALDRIKVVAFDEVDDRKAVRAQAEAPAAERSARREAQATRIKIVEFDKESAEEENKQLSRDGRRLKIVEFDKLQ
jgi:ribose transport system ATP-binding protein